MATDPTSFTPWFTFGGGAAIATVGTKLIDFAADWFRERAKEKAASRQAEEERASAQGAHALDRLGDMLLARLMQLQEQTEHLQARCDRLEAEKDELQEQVRHRESENERLRMQAEFSERRKDGSEAKDKNANDEQ